MQSGKLRHRVQIQTTIYRQDEFFDPLADPWQTIATVWAEVIPLQGIEAIRAKQIVATATHKVTIRYFEGITSQYRLLFNNRVLEVDGPPLNTDERGIYTVLLCREVEQPRLTKNGYANLSGGGSLEARC
jgi:SPP1 family predicted phage head-tail adaptor